MENKVTKPKELTDAEADGFIRYLTGTKARKKTLAEALLEYSLSSPKVQKKILVEALLETKIGQQLFQEWIRKKAAKK